MVPLYRRRKLFAISKCGKFHFSAERFSRPCGRSAFLSHHFFRQIRSFVCIMVLFSGGLFIMLNCFMQERPARSAFSAGQSCEITEAGQSPASQLSVTFNSCAAAARIPVHRCAPWRARSAAPARSVHRAAPAPWTPRPDRGSSPSAIRTPDRRG